MSTLLKVSQAMGRASFLQKAQAVSANPMDRIPATIHHLLDPTSTSEDKNIFIDVHAHSFTLSHVPANFNKLLNLLPDRARRKFLDWVDRKFDQSFIKYLIKNRSVDIIDQLIEDYISVLSQNPQNTQSEVFIVNLLMDMERGIGGGVKSDYVSQINEIIELRKNNPAFIEDSHKFNYAEKILPFFALDPHNKDLFKQFLTVFIPGNTEFPELKINAVNFSFVGVKLYPPLGYLPYDPTLMDVFEVCEQKNIPALTHIGGYRTKTEFDNVELGHRKYNPDGTILRDDYKTMAVYTRDAKGRRADTKVKDLFIQPRLWREVLDRFPKLKLCLAHLGDKKEWTAFRKLEKEMGIKITSSNMNSLTNLPFDITRNHVWQSLDMMKKYPGCYGDVSYSITTKENILLIKEWMKDPVFSKKLMYGSDFYLTEVEKLRTRYHVENLFENFQSMPEQWLELTSSNIKQYLFSK